MNNLMFKLLPILLTQMSSPLRDFVATVVGELKAKAKETDNPIDDVVVEILAVVLGLD